MLQNPSPQRTPPSSWPPVTTFQLFFVYLLIKSSFQTKSFHRTCAFSNTATRIAIPDFWLLHPINPVSKKVKSNEDLCSEIREFLSTVGYPEDHVPSMKELAQHGRKDLAHMVRRRGYKLIRQILQSSATRNLIKFDIEMDETGKLKMFGGSGGQNEKLKASVGDVLPRDVMEEGDLYRYQEKDGDLFSSDQRSVASDSSIPFMQEKVANFIKHGKLVGIDEKIYAGEGERGTESEDAHEVQNTSSNQGNNNLLLQSSIGGETLNINSMNTCVSKEEQTPVNHKNDLDDEVCVHHNFNLGHDLFGL
ncbi:uncharacterized protein LOC142551828 isoform X2 [Primulina tabacum]|uniref:uncharacterized protein LOC142551828 isoform X2 n=1 Tax=Primulina tabacum TaxID=48773 RepID=UPI003F5ADBD7